ncbi:MAG: hypothetical protein H0W62_13595 [Chitinophagales bacterium]|nr:hypothetical protein [Chitinophagales bacterium]
MKTIAIILISLFGFNSPSSAKQPYNSGECCPNANAVAKTDGEQRILDQLQHESELMLADNSTIEHASHLKKAVSYKLEEKTMADRIQMETEEFSANLPLAITHPVFVTSQNQYNEEGIMEKLQRETESISVTKPLFYVASMIAVKNHGKAAHTSFNTARKH